MPKFTLPLNALKSVKPVAKDEDDSGEMMSVPKHDVYQDADKGPFKCANCEYFTAPTKCSQPEIVKLRQGNVTAEACCDYFEKK